MSLYEINKGVGKGVEFKGLKAQYLIYFAVILVGSFLLVILLTFLGLSQPISAVIGVAVAVTGVSMVFTFNKKYGEYGLMKLTAKKYRPDYLSNRRRARTFLNGTSKKINTYVQ